MKIFITMFWLMALSLSAAAQKTVVPIVDVNSGALLGGVENGRFLNSKTTFGKLKGDTKFLLFDFQSGKKSEISVGAFKEGIGACPENYFVEPQIEVDADFAVGANSSWEILPRKPIAVSLTDGGYKKAVADVLRLRGLSKSPVKITQAVQIDLDGDGRKEVLLVASHYAEDASQNAKTGSYSFLMIRKTIGGKPQNIYVNGNIIKNKNDYYDGDYSVSGIADLNGDGKMEIIVEISGYEENWTKVFEIKAGKPTEIKALSYYCGV